MAQTAMPEVIPGTGTKERSAADLDPGYLVICWNDPVNLMHYVTHIFQQIFGWSRPKAERHMKEVHEKGRSLLTRESFEKAEHFVHQLQQAGLHATLEPAE
ncbi:MAG: ATP-dependent Clp protease adaptor ClpS [Verrucomicrobia bacterium]|nr:ATP-dependent Clp protease adaptor ClpS [Verrucomicrobiota bacterium]